MTSSLMPTLAPWPAAALDELAAAFDALEDGVSLSEPLEFLALLTEVDLHAFARRAENHLYGHSNPVSWAIFLAAERLAFHAWLVQTGLPATIPSLRDDRIPS